MKTAFLSLVFFSAVITEVNGQYNTNQNKVWAFGNHAGVNFTTGSPVSFSTSISTPEGCASVCNTAGSLLFYTDGKTVYNNTGAVMPSGSSIVSFSTASTGQAAAIVPVIGNANQYYLFSLEQYGGSTGFGHLAYSIVDMSLDGGLGDLVSGSTGIPMTSVLSERMTTIAGNSCNVWLIVHRKDSAVFLAYNITATGIGTPVVSNVGSFSGTNSHTASQIKSSPNRLKIASQSYQTISTAKGTELFDFDPGTGTVSNCQLLDNSISEYGVEFSPDNTKLYAEQSPDISGQIYQYDISLTTTTAIIASKTYIATGHSDMKLAADNKIYFVAASTGYLDCISAPNAAGTSCDYTSHAVTLATSTNGVYGLPNIVISVAPNDTFYTFHDTSACIPAGGSITIAAHDTSTGSGYLWNDGVTTTRTRSITTYGIYWVGIYNGCGLTMDTIHVAPLLADSVMGTAALCAGGTAILTPSAGGGMWSSSPATGGIATVNTTGIVTGVSAGTAIISYNSSTYCPVSAIITVNVTPAAITGTPSVCTGATTTLGNSITGGTWSNAGTSVATIDTGTGIITGVTAGTVTISYTLPGGCMATVPVTVLASPAAILGASSVCVGGGTWLTDTTGSDLAPIGGGLWGISPFLLGYIDVTATNDTSGYFVGLTAESGFVTYTASNGCIATKAMTVGTPPGSIVGAATLCAGGTTVLTDGGPGTWSSTNTAIATIDPAGVVHGIAAGTSVITFTPPGTGCTVSYTVTVNPLPMGITGLSNICNGATTTLLDATTGGAWSSGNTTVATINALSGVVTGIATPGPGSATISYTLPTGCAAVASITVNPAPGAISAPAALCVGYGSSLNAYVGGGTWSNSNTAVATIVYSFSFSGDINSLSPGVTVISYTLPDGCASYDTLTVYPPPYLVIGPPTICVGQTTTLSDVATGGTWTTDGAAITVDLFSGDVDGISAGVASITYTLSTGCSITKTMTVNTSPGAITGAPYVCQGLTTALSDGGSGSWTSGNTMVATIGSTGIVSGVASGTTIITFSVGASCTTSETITVNPLPTAISGTPVACAGSTTALSDGAGTWSSGSTGIATIGSSSGIVNGLSGGTATITFTLSTGCYTTRTLTINPLPLTITGTLTVCPGATTVLNDLTTGGTWSSGSTGIATIATSGIVSGLAPGTSVITYTAPGTGCSRTAVVTVNPLPALPTAAAICAGATTTLSDATSGGTWSSGATSFATITSTGTVTGVMGGTTATISYTLGTGCARQAIVTVNQIPTITGPTAECVGATMTETPTPTGGTWVSTATSVATIGSTGTVTGAATGTTVITYTSLAGCKSTTTITISLSPTAILGSSTVCANDTVSISDAVGGGLWSSSNTAVATIGSLTPIVTGVAAGTTMITYSLGTTGCTVTKIISVNPAPAGITGGTSMCIGGAATLMDATTGGMWVSASTSTATVLSTGLVTGVAAGTVTVSYVVITTGCPASVIVTVNATPSAVTGAADVCSGSTTTLGDAVTGGTWTSSSTAIAVVSAGAVTGVSAGTTVITYSLGAGCAVTKVVTVNPIAAITVSLGICVGATTVLADGVSGGTWSSGTTLVAAISSPATGGITGTAPGTSAITYTTAAGCTATAVVTVNLAPSAISGILHVCAGATTSLGNTAGGGTWVSSNTAVAAVGSTGIVTGTIHGTATITYSLGSGCTVTAIVTVNAAPAAISGVTNVCAGANTALNDATTGGTWSIAPTVAVPIVIGMTSTGMVTGLSAGTAIISYAIAGGCATSAIVTVNPIPTPIIGVSDICVGITAALADGISGGTWSSPDLTVGIGTMTGVVTGISTGSATITYTLSTGCSANTTITVNAAPAPISGVTNVCIGSVIALSDPPGGGAWSSGNTGVASITGTGIVSGIALGTSTISYTAGGCPATIVVTVNSLPEAIGGTARVCVGSTTTLSDLPGGGTWSIAGGGVATVDATGIVTGVAVGMATIAYSAGAGCTVTAIVTVDAVPLPISGVAEVCVGYTTTLSDASAGVWSSSNTSIATIIPIATGTGIVSGAAGGPSTISYTNSMGCAATRLVTVIAVPPILGVSNMCAFSATLPLYDSATGGFWTSTLASISSSGVVTPYSAGVATITYTLPLGCYITAALTVNPLPGPVMGLNHLCLGSTITMSDTSSGGTWSSSNTTVAAISSPATGGIEGSSAGVSIIRYALGTGCATTETITVDVFPSAGTISGLSVVCVGSDIVLADGVFGGEWSASNIAASVFEGMVTGVTAGTDIISYTVSNSCGSAFTTKAVTINPLPVAGIITGPSNVCTGDSTVLADLTAGGFWSSSASVASVVAGVVSGMSVGVDTIKYTVTNSCGIAYAAKVVTVNSLPNAGAINGTDSICIGAFFTLTDTVAGGAWGSSSGLISISSSGLISAVSAGADTITYSVTNSCGTATASAVVAVKPGPLAGTITGGGVICSGAKDTLVGTPVGGDWSSSNGNAVITDLPAGVIIAGVSAGADTITYTLSNECGQAVAVFPVTVYTIEECDSITATPGRSSVAEQLHIWPNPNDGLFTVMLSARSDQPVDFAITNILGEKIKDVSAATNKPTTIKLNNAAGVYFVTASTAQGSYIAKIIFTR